MTNKNKKDNSLNRYEVKFKDNTYNNDVLAGFVADYGFTRLMKYLIPVMDYNRDRIALDMEEKRSATEIEIPLPDVEDLVIPTRFNKTYNMTSLRVVSDISELDDAEIDETMIITRTFGFNKFAAVLKKTMQQGNLALVGKGSKVLGRVSKGFTAVRHVLDEVWEFNEARLYVLANNGDLVDVTAGGGFNRIIEEARGNSEIRSTRQYMKHTDTGRLTSPINYYLRELNSLEVAIDKTYTWIYQYKGSYKPLTTEDIIKVAKKVYKAIQTREHGVYTYSYDRIVKALLELKDRVDEIGTEYTIKICMKCMVAEIGKSAQLCKPCIKDSKIIFDEMRK